MESFKNILVAVDVVQAAHRELERAQQIARYSGGSLHIVDVLRDMSFAGRLFSHQWQAEHEQLAQEKLHALEALAEKSRQQGVPATCELLRGKFSQRLIEAVETRHIDLIVRTAKGARSSEPGYIGSTSSQLLLHAPCALWLTQGEHAAGCKRVLAAIDATPDDQAHAALNRSILQRGRDLVEREACELHVVYVWDLYGAELMRGRIPDSELEAMLERNRALHEESYEGILNQFGLHTQDANVHMLRGEATVAIPQLCARHEIDLLICGTVSRIGLTRIMIGNTANRMLHRVPCSILAIKPEETGTSNG